MDNAFGQPQRVIVLGGSSEIARAITKKLVAARAHTVVLAGRNPELLARASEEALEYGATSTPLVHLDAERPDSAAQTVDEAFDAAGGSVDLVIVAVGRLGVQSNDEVSPEETLRMMNVNFTWPVVALTQIRNRLVAQGSGRILVISSVASVRVRRSAYLYGGAKAGLDRLTDALADSLEGTGVTLQLLRPGAVRTRMTAGLAELPFMTGPNEVAEYVMAGLSTNQRVIWSPPILRWVYLVLRHLPRQLWRMVMDR
jgi:decaprenylphospho-beta-D-erythro-pentofuranosid-2-ulose 2-reductase